MATRQLADRRVYRARCPPVRCKILQIVHRAIHRVKASLIASCELRPLYILQPLFPPSSAPGSICLSNFLGGKIAGASFLPLEILEIQIAAVNVTLALQTTSKLSCGRNRAPALVPGGDASNRAVSDEKTFFVPLLGAPLWSRLSPAITESRQLPSMAASRQFYRAE